MNVTSAPATILTDVNVYLSRYPFRRLPLDEPDKLAAKLRALHVTQAWVGSFDALLHRDLEGVNARLAADCRRFGDGLFLPFGAINPLLPDWEEDLRRCHETHQFRGVRLHPNYHGYKLDDPAFAQLLAQAAARNLIVQIVDHVEDERTHHPLLRVPPVDLSPLPKLLPQFHGVKLVLLNTLRTARGEPLASLTRFPNVHLDIAALEGVGGIGNVLDRFPADRLLFGSHAPFFYPESAVQKLIESAIGGDVLEQVSHQNAAALLKA